jgi:hypothetical protein
MIRRTIIKRLFPSVTVSKFNEFSSTGPDSTVFKRLELANKKRVVELNGRESFIFILVVFLI